MSTVTSNENHGYSDVAVAGCNCEACFNLRGHLSTDPSSHCGECGMVILTPGEYHPYAACAMYKQWGDSHAVRVSLAAIIEHGNKARSNETCERPLTEEEKGYARGLADAKAEEAEAVASDWRSAPWEVEQERKARPAFEELLAYHTTDSDGHARVIKPWRSVGPHSQYTRMTDAALPEKWYWFNAGWYAKWRQS